MDSINAKEMLVAQLKTISDDREFLIAVINHVKREEDRIALAQYIKNNPSVSDEDVILISLEIYQKT